MDMAKRNALVLALEDWVRPDDILRMPPECTENLVSGCGKFAAIDVLRHAVELRKPKMDHIDVLVQMISVRSLSINAGVLPITSGCDKKPGLLFSIACTHQQSSVRPGLSARTNLHTSCVG